MSRQPYIYTMPEGFLADDSIGVKWKIYAIINGFWISGKVCYAANPFFSEKLGVSERQIRNGLAQLEADGYIKRLINGHSRTIVPAAEIHEEAEAGVPPPGSESSAQAEAGVPPISVSISDSINTASRIVLEVKDNPPLEEGAERRAKDDTAVKAARKWHKLAEDATGREPSGGMAKTQRILMNAHATLTWGQISDKMTDWFDNNPEELEDHDLIQVSRCFSNYQIDKFLSDV